MMERGSGTLTTARHLGLVAAVAAVAAIAASACTPPTDAPSGEGHATGGGAGEPAAGAASPMFGGHPAHTGVVATRGLPTQPRPVWTFETGGTVRSTPALVDGVLYVGSSDGHLYAVAAADGSELWAFEAGAPIASSPAVVGNVVIVGDRANTWYGIARSDGRERWRLQAGPDLPLDWGWEGWDYLTASAVIADRDAEPVAIFGSGDGVLRAVQPESGAVVWTFATDRRIRATPSVDGDLVVFGGGDGVVYALDLTDGAPVWTFETAGTRLEAADFGFDRRQIYGSAAIADGVAYVGSRDGSLYALDLETGDVLWHAEDGTAWVINTPAVAGDVVYSGRSSGGMFRARSAADGAIRWEYSTGGLVFGSPVVVGDLVYVASGGGSVTALETASGTVRWRYFTGAPIVASPVVAGGRLYVAADDGTVTALASTGLPTPRLAVFHDEGLRSRSAFGASPEHERVMRYFQRRGYLRLDAAGLGAFLEEQGRSDAPSVVVMGMDALPDDVVEGPGGGSPLLEYLRAGGKIVWLGFPPGVLSRDEEGRVLGVDRDVPGSVLHVDFTPWNSDQYGTEATAEGRAWGWDEWTIGSPSVSAASVDHVLAVDEQGRPAAWVKEYGGPRGTGFVFLPAVMGSEELDAVRRVAEIGLMRGFDDTGP